MTKLTKISIKRILTTDKIPLSTLLQLINVMQIVPVIDCKFLTDIVDVTSLPRLRIVKLKIPAITNFKTILEIIACFIIDKKNVRGVFLDIISDIISFQFNESVKIKFLVTQHNYPLILGFNDKGKPVWTPNVDQIIEFIKLYRKHSPFKVFNTAFLYKCRFQQKDIVKLADYLSTISELESYHILNHYTTILDKIIDNITSISYNMFPCDFPRNKRIKIIDNIGLTMFPSSPKILEFYVPVHLKYIHLIIEKYPNVECISVITDKILTPKNFLQYPKLKKIHCNIIKT